MGGSSVCECSIIYGKEGGEELKAVKDSVVIRKGGDEGGTWRYIVNGKSVIWIEK